MWDVKHNISKSNCAYGQFLISFARACMNTLFIIKVRILFLERSYAWYVESGCPMLICWHSTLFWVFTVIVTKHNYGIFNVVAILRMNQQSWSFWKFGYDPRQFIWAKRQCICEGNLIAHINVSPVPTNYVEHEARTMNKVCVHSPISFEHMSFGIHSQIHL